MATKPKRPNFDHMRHFAERDTPMVMMPQYNLWFLEMLKEASEIMNDDHTLSHKYFVRRDKWLKKYRGEEDG